MSIIDLPTKGVPSWRGLGLTSPSAESYLKARENDELVWFICQSIRSGEGFKCKGCPSTVNTDHGKGSVLCRRLAEEKIAFVYENSKENLKFFERIRYVLFGR